MSIPPPPPPRPPPSPSKTGDDSHQSTGDTELRTSHDLQLNLLIDKLRQWNSLSGTPVTTISTPVKHVSQFGPQCGLVALSMASSVYHRGVPVPQLLSLARQSGLTNFGEMFSVDWMLQLANTAIPDCSAEIIGHDQLADHKFVAHNIARGNMLLVPYDSDRNFSPACLQGHKAHWSVVTGVIVPASPSTSSTSHLNLSPGEYASSLLSSLLTDDLKVHVLALQGKSRHLSAWPLDHLVASNKNLVQVDPTKDNSEIKYVLPPGGILEGLCGKAVLLKCQKFV